MTTQITQPTTQRFIKLQAVMNITGLSRSTIYRYIADGHFPRQVSLGTRNALGLKVRSKAGLKIKSTSETACTWQADVAQGRDAPFLFLTLVKKLLLKLVRAKHL